MFKSRFYVFVKTVQNPNLQIIWGLTSLHFIHTMVGGCSTHRKSILENSPKRSLPTYVPLQTDSERAVSSPHYSAYGVTSQIIWVEVTSRHLFLAITLPQFGAKPGFSRATGAPLRLFLKLDEFRWVAEVS